jgi:hypothetical protein
MAEASQGHAENIRSILKAIKDVKTIIAELRGDESDVEFERAS